MHQLPAIVLLLTMLPATEGTIHSAQEISTWTTDNPITKGTDRPTLPFQLINAPEGSNLWSSNGQELRDKPIDFFPNPEGDAVMAVSSVSLLSSEVQGNGNQSIGSSRGQKRFHPESSAHSVLQTKARETLRMNSRPSRMYPQRYQERKSSADPVETRTAPQASMHFVSHEPAAHPVIKLLGVFMAPHVQRISFDSNDLVKIPEAHQADSYSTINAGMDSTPRNYDFLLFSQTTLDPSTSSPTKTSLNLSINNESPARILANQIEDTVHRDSQDQIKIQHELTKIRFDKELFKNLDYFLDMFDLLSQKEELVMSEREFIVYHIEFSDRLKVARENLAKQSLESDNSELDQNLGKSVEKLLRHQELWHMHWKRLTDFQFTSCIQKIKHFKSLRTRSCYPRSNHQWPI
ncbi:uncharacterized protein PGTG_07918 [Puccinia graminis f. sp. tritici CRL 75-36-700-3]|uniref:Uncharacterized protein n=1 Tax=Puccinia graminis f. sp. tritici (strain CRL 75-36-700-3 / race SCCL) TaxID=418459 RepID=E3KBF7_PUCGT|nr:uncharacterized protein PGTG_07918 [Puccinia graminis f. sp. tritici CRL 75-36-700-3]EFP81669.2 hypothetical protein PGTG_07918 [Puccinia graminis f. sp. tritici CRL 75-36-700-3]